MSSTTKDAFAAATRQQRSQTTTSTGRRRRRPARAAVEVRGGAAPRRPVTISRPSISRAAARSMSRRRHRHRCAHRHSPKALSMRLAHRVLSPARRPCPCMHGARGGQTSASEGEARDAAPTSSALRECARWMALHVRTERIECRRKLMIDDSTVAQGSSTWDAVVTQIARGWHLRDGAM